ncbi:MAG: hypothetical protein HY097_05455 [Nitrospinae bacterium]|nr:hypothetical protein [Nitrospinota bacterium]
MKGRNIAALLVIAAVAFVGSMFIAKDASAVPGFARQTGHSCTTCHYQSFPSLNSFGRAFKAGGYTQIGGQKKIEDEGLSIPDVLNLSLVVKLRYQSTNGDTKAGTDRGAIQIPDEAAIMAGGRGGEHIGFLLERGLKESGGFDNFKLIFPFDMGGTTIAVGAFTTADQGPAYGFETLNTGAIKIHKPYGEGVATSAQQYTGLNGPAATGIVLYGASDMFFINASLWGPSHSDDIPSGLNLAQYIRAAVTPNLGGWDTAIGAQLYTGETKLGEAASDTHVVQGTAFDLQLLGEVGGMNLGVYATYATVPKAGTDGKKYDIASATGDKSATSIAVNLGVIPNKASVGFVYLTGKNGATSKDVETRTLITGVYDITQNAKLQLDYALLGGDADQKTAYGYTNKTTLMLFSAF